VKKPDSPYRNRNAITPTSGGSRTGSDTSAPSTRRPGKSRRANRNASGTPTRAEKSTLAIEIQTLFQSARNSEELLAKRV
jgi:hypothetical protein